MSRYLFLSRHTAGIAILLILLVTSSCADAVMTGSPEHTVDDAQLATVPKTSGATQRNEPTVDSPASGGTRQSASLSQVINPDGSKTLTVCVYGLDNPRDNAARLQIRLNDVLLQSIPIQAVATRDSSYIAAFIAAVAMLGLFVYRLLHFPSSGGPFEQPIVSMREQLSELRAVRTDRGARMELDKLSEQLSQAERLAAGYDEERGAKEIDEISARLAQVRAELANDLYTVAAECDWLKGRWDAQVQDSPQTCGAQIVGLFRIAHQQLALRRVDDARSELRALRQTPWGRQQPIWQGLPYSIRVVGGPHAPAVLMATLYRWGRPASGQQVVWSHGNGNGPEQTVRWPSPGVLRIEAVPKSSDERGVHHVGIAPPSVAAELQRSRRLSFILLGIGFLIVSIALPQLLYGLRPLLGETDITMSFLAGLCTYKALWVILRPTAGWQFTVQHQARRISLRRRRERSGESDQTERANAP